MRTRSQDCSGYGFIVYCRLPCAPRRAERGGPWGRAAGRGSRRHWTINRDCQPRPGTRAAGSAWKAPRRARETAVLLPVCVPAVRSRPDTRTAEDLEKDMHHVLTCTRLVHHHRTCTHVAGSLAGLVHSRTAVGRAGVRGSPRLMVMLQSSCVRSSTFRAVAAGVARV